MKNINSSIKTGPRKGEHCPFCGAEKFYELSDGRYKCAVCKRRYAPKKRQRERRLIQLFCREYSALQAAKEVNISYVTVKNYFDRMRHLLPALLEADYEQNRDQITEYDEYFYLDHSKRKNKKCIFDAHNLLTFDYGGKVYSILMPPLDRYKQAFLDDRLEDLYYREFSQFLNLHRIAKLKSRENTIVRFWRFLDEHMKLYRGVHRENFFYYLKEAEFFFNYPMPYREEVLRSLASECNA
ncbi:transposase [Nitratifractor sp.]|uniref:transposase n=1 Tax=Nitratifractor sp. TaxID=2268144 RepID=UPI0025E9CB8D|nr:transposase [Nitratifractor sp.]